MTAPAWRATALSIVGVCMLGGYVVIALQVTRTVPSWCWPGPGAIPPNSSSWLSVVALLPCLMVSVLLTSRLPGAAVSRVITIFTLCAVTSLFIDAVGWLGSRPLGLCPPQFWRAVISLYPHLEDAMTVASVVASVLWAGTVPLIAVLAVVFPDGVPSRGWWRRVFIGQMIALGVAVFVLAGEAIGNGGAVYVAAWNRGAVYVAAWVVVGVWILLIGSGVLRAVYLVWLWWQSEGERRRQLFPFVATAGVMALFCAVYFVKAQNPGNSGFGVEQLPSVLAGLFLCGLPTAVGLSVLRHRLFGIEITLNRLAVATCLSLLLFGVYAGTAAIVSAIAGGEGVQWRPLLAAGVTVGALGPVYRLARSIVDRIMFGDRERPDRVLRALASSLGETLDPLEVPQTVVNAVAETLRLPFVALDRLTPAGRVRSAAVGLPPASGARAALDHRAHADQISVFPIAFGGQPLAEMLVTPRVGQDSLNATDRELLSDLATQAGPALYAGRLIDELTDSRERLRLGRLEERAALRRALHDGISPTLAGIAIAAAAARVREPGDPTVHRLLDRIEQEAGTGSTTLRALLAGLRPPGLSELGLAAAIEQRAAELGEAAGIPFDVRNQEPLPALDPDVEQTAYLVTVEGMVNVAKHAAAQHCWVTVAGHGDTLNLEVIDDGYGMPSEQRDGEGLRSARERVQACGGTLTLTNNNGGGSRLAAKLPVWAGP